MKEDIYNSIEKRDQAEDFIGKKSDEGVEKGKGVGKNILQGMKFVALGDAIVIGKEFCPQGIYVAD